MGLGWHAEGILTLGSLESLDNPARLVRLHENAVRSDSLEAFAQSL
jgi:hypothetical protein